MNAKDIATRPKGGWWPAVKITFAIAHSAGVIFLAMQAIEMMFPDPGPRDPDAPLAAAYQGIALGILGLPWSIAVFVGFADSRPAASAWAVAHRWVPILLLVLAAALNNVLLWWWALRQRSARSKSAADGG